MQPPEEIDFADVLKALLDAENLFPPRYLHRLSDLEEGELHILSESWDDIPLSRRRSLMEDIEDLSKTDMLVSFEALGRLSIQDQDANVRLHSVHTLAEFENKQLIPIFMKLLQNDPNTEVRSASAEALGHYVYLGEIEELPIQKLHEIEETLLAISQGDAKAEVRRSALESLGYSSREEVNSLIRRAFKSGDREWILSALVAMGHSGNEVWEKPVLEMLQNPHPSLRGAAARAAGELELPEAVPILLELLEDPSDAIRDASIWSLSQIGGEGVRDRLENLYDQVDDDEEIDLLESALDNLTFTEGMQLMPLFDLPKIEEDSNLDDTIGNEIDEFIFDEDEENQED